MLLITAAPMEPTMVGCGVHALATPVCSEAHLDGQGSHRGEGHDEPDTLHTIAIQDPQVVVRRVSRHEGDHADERPCDQHLLPQSGT